MRLSPIRAVKRRDPNALQQAFADVAEAKVFRCEVLPHQLPDDCRWFWQQVMTDDQLEQMLSLVRDVCLKTASDKMLRPGTDFSLGTLEGLPSLICSAETAEHFYEALPIDRHSILRFYLQVI